MKKSLYLCSRFPIGRKLSRIAAVKIASLAQLARARDL